jgi:hypothetical protein
MEVKRVSGSEPPALAERQDHASLQRQPSPDHKPDPQTSRFEAVLEDGKEIVYRATDPETGLVLVEVPSEEVRRVAERLKQLMSQGKIG